MAWRDSRTSRGRLLVFSSSISLGIGALVAVGSLGQNLREAIEAQSKSLLGADLVFTRREPFAPEDRALLQRIGGQRAEETSFTTMLSLNQGTRLVNARALTGGFPFYGTLETDPPSAAEEFRKGGGVLVEEGILLQFGSRIGEFIQLGQSRLRILGALRRVPGDTVAFATLAPRVYLSGSDLAKTGLIQSGSLARFRIQIRLPQNTDPAALLAPMEETLLRRHIEYDTVKKRQRDLGDSLANLYRFLNLVGLVALILGAIGIASAIQIHVLQKLPHAAILRCLGGSTPRVFAVYLAQGITLGTFGSLMGVGLGSMVARQLPGMIGNIVPFQFEPRFAWAAAGLAASGGFLLCILFALLPLLELRKIPPLAAIRVTAFQLRRFDPARGWVMALIVGGITTFAVLQSRRLLEGLAVAGGLAAAFLLLAGTARALIFTTRRLPSHRLPFVWRQGIASLHRPQNRTTLLLLSIGLGTFLILTLHLVRNSLLQQLFPPSASGKPNTILFDIQPDQRPGVLAILAAHHLPALEQAPIVTMRLQSLKGVPTDRINRPGTRTPSVPEWALRREYRSTWRDRLIDTETLTAGAFVPHRTGDLSERNPVPVSVEDGIAHELHLSLGDDLVFDVQGVPVPCRIASLRKVDWRQVRPNFFFLFPEGALEDAPAQFIVATRIDSPTASAAFQRDLLKDYPNVSTVDLTLILQTLDAILSKVGFVIRFMALFTAVTGLIVLAGSIATGRWQRLQEAVLLRTLGASRSQLRRILLAEYVTLGSLAAATGIGLAVAASSALAVFAFKATPVIPPAPLVVTWLAVTSLTVFVGLVTNRGIVRSSPLEILRTET